MGSVLFRLFKFLQLITMRAFAIACLAIAAVVAESDPEAYTPFQVATGQTAGGVITGVDYGHGSGLVPAVGVAPVARTTSYAARPAVTYAARPAVSYTTPVVSNVAPAVVSTYNTLPYTSYAGHHLGYSGLLGYNRHFVAKREADSEADAYTPAQVALGLPYANAVATGNAHNPGYITNAVVPAATYSHVVPATTYSHAVPATTYSHAVPATTYSHATLPYATGYTGHLGYGYGLRSSLWL